MTKPKRPRDTNQLAKLIADIATGEKSDLDTTAGKNPAAVALGRNGGLKGGKARAAKLSDARLSEIGKMGAKVRWKELNEQRAASASAKARPKRKVLKADPANDK